MEDRVERLEQRAESIEARMAKMEIGLAQNTQTTNDIKRDTGKLLAMFEASKFGVEAIKWMTTVGGAILLAWVTVKGVK